MKYTPEIIEAVISKRAELSLSDAMFSENQRNSIMIEAAREAGADEYFNFYSLDAIFKAVNTALEEGDTDPSSIVATALKFLNA